MEQCTFITGTDKNIILSMNTFFYNLNQKYNTLNLFDTDSIHSTAPKIHSLSTSLIDLHLHSHKNNDTNTIFLCFRAPEIPSLENIEERLFANYFNTEFFFTIELLRKSFFFLSNKKDPPSTTQNSAKYTATIRKNIFVVLPQMDKDTASEKNIFIRMLVHAYIHFSKHMLALSKYPVTITLLHYHPTIPFAMKTNMIQHYIAHALHVRSRNHSSLLHSLATIGKKWIMPILRNKQAKSRLVIKKHSLPLFRKKKE